MSWRLPNRIQAGFDDAPYEKHRAHPRPRARPRVCLRSLPFVKNSSVELRSFLRSNARMPCRSACLRSSLSSTGEGAHFGDPPLGTLLVAIGQLIPSFRTGARLSFAFTTSCFLRHPRTSGQPARAPEPCSCRAHRTGETERILLTNSMRRMKRRLPAAFRFSKPGRVRVLQVADCRLAEIVRRASTRSTHAFALSGRLRSRYAGW